MATTLTASDLVHRLRTGGGVYEPRAVEIDWRSSFGDGPVLETGFDPETGGDASSDDAALSGDDLHRVSTVWPSMRPWRDSYVIRAVTA